MSPFVAVASGLLQVGANIATIAETIVLLSKRTNKPHPSKAETALAPTDAILADILKLLEDHQDKIDTATHSELHERYDRLVVAREILVHDGKTKGRLNRRRHQEHEESVVVLNMDVIRSSGLARSLTMWDKNSVQKTSESRTSSRPQASGSSAQLPTSPTNAGSSNEGQGNVRDDPFSDPSGEPATAAASGSGSEQYVYAASAALNPFHNNPAIIVSTVDLAAVGENSRLQVALIPRNLEESIVLRSMPFAEAFPGNVIQRSMSEIHE